MTQYTLINGKAFSFSLLSLFATLYSFNSLSGVSFFNRSFSVHSNVTFIAFFSILYFLYYKYFINKGCTFSMQSKIIGLFAGLINVMGRNFELYNSLQFFSKEVYFAIIFSLVATIGYGLIYASLFELGWSYLRAHREQHIERKDTYLFLKTINHTVFDNHPLLYPFLLICLFWFPYLVSFYPGMIHWDAVEAFLGYNGVITWSSHHPVIGTLLMGYIMDIGKFFRDDNLGCAIYVILQFFLLSITLAYQFVFFNKWKTNYSIRWMVLFIFLLHPVFPMFVMNVVKDVFYYIAYLWLLYLFMRSFEEYNVLFTFCIVIASMFVCALRKEGMVVCVICSVVLLFFRDIIYQKWKNILNAILLGSILATFLSYGASVYYNVARSTVAEALSLPLQQTARYIRDYSDDVTDSEWKVLNAIFENQAKKLGSYYDPDISDPVKNQINGHFFKMHMTAYIKVWRSHFFRHPDCYFAAAFNQLYGYFYIGKGAMYKIGDCRTENFVKGDIFYGEHFKIVDDPKTIAFRKVMKKYVYSWPELPVLGLLYHPAVYTWILFFGLSGLIQLKKYKYLFLYCMPLAVLCICCLSPVNAFIRYFFPVMASSFILAVYNLRLVC